MPSKKKIRTAGAIYLRRRDRIDHPNGKFDKAGRWYPDASEKLDKTQYRSPSAAYPWSYMHACRTIKHAAKLGGVPHHAAEVRHQAKRIVSEAALLGRTLDVFTAQILAGTA